ncbi:MAG: hypothetical protein ACOX2S_05410 [bacterium]|jgi:hypothetical protein
MRPYNEYMDKTSVSGTLHQRIISFANGRPKRHPIVTKHYAAAFACLAVALLGAFTIPRLMQYNITPTAGNHPAILQPGSRTTISNPYNKYTLDFNRAEGQLAAKVYIPGHFWQELTDKELKAAFPGLTETHSITATANFQSDERGASLFNIDAHAVSATGLKTYIQLAPGEVILDYKFAAEAKPSYVLGTAVMAGYFETQPNSKGPSDIIYFASFKLSGIAYYVELGGAEAEKEALKDEISELIGLLIEGGAADLSVLHPVVPELREDRLNLDEAHADADFGAYLPATLPEGFVFQDALRFINQERNELNVRWEKGMGYIDWRVSYLDGNDKARITSVADRKNYDLSLYPIPRADSVPDDLREIVDNPIFLIDELTLAAVRSRTYEVSDSGDEPGSRMKFGVLYEDVLVELTAKDAKPEAMFDVLQQIRKEI